MKSIEKDIAFDSKLNNIDETAQIKLGKFLWKNMKLTLRLNLNLTNWVVLVQNALRKLDIMKRKRYALCQRWTKN